jgi:hypothetical protein
MAVYFQRRGLRTPGKYFTWTLALFAFTTWNFAFIKTGLQAAPLLPL